MAPIEGKYQLESSEKFDDFLKELGKKIFICNLSLIISMCLVIQASILFYEIWQKPPSQQLRSQKMVIIT